MSIFLDQLVKGEKKEFTQDEYDKDYELKNGWFRVCSWKVS